MIIPAPFALIYMSSARGYSAAMLLVSISFFLLSKSLSKTTNKHEKCIAQDLQVAMVALGIWFNTLTVLITIPCLLIPLLKKLTGWREHLVLRILLVILILSPVIYYNIETRSHTVKVIAGFAWDAPKGKEDIEELGIHGVISRSIQQRLSGYGEGLWKRFVRFWGELLIANVSRILPEELSFLGIVVFVALLIFLGLSVIRLPPGERSWVFLVGGLISLVIVVGFSQQRYVSVTFPLVPIFLTLCLYRQRIIFPIVILILLALNFAGTLMLQFPGEDFKAVLQFLKDKNMRFCYTDYNNAYPLTFLSEESIVCSPLGGPNDTDRYPKYSQRVAAAQNIFYLYDFDDEPRGLLERYLVKHGISYTVTEISGRKIYYDFSNKILPSDFRSAGISKSK